MAVGFSIRYGSRIYIWLLRLAGMLTLALFQSDTAAVSMDKHNI